MEMIFSAIAILAAIVSLVGTYWFNHRLLGVESMASLSHIIQLEIGIADIPSAFKFHGISEADIEEVGITHKELAYLVASTTAGGIYHRTNSPAMKEPFSEGSYRYRMCSTEEFRKAWPLVKLMMNESNYTRRIDATIQVVEASP